MSCYPIKTVLRARELVEGGWLPAHVPALLEREGLGRPSHTTISLWADPVRYEAHMARSLATAHERAARSGAFRLPGRSSAYRREFMVKLRSEGLSYHAIGVVHGVVFGERLTDDQVRYALRELPTPGAST